MSTVTQLKATCPQCHKKIEKTLGEFTANGSKFYILGCGHFYAVELVQADNYDKYASLEGDKPYPFQLDGIKFIEQAGGRALIADEMGLGKTIQALGWLFLHEEAQPALFIVKKKLTLQFFKQIYRWNGMAMSQIINQGQALLPGLKYYVISMDLLKSYPMERFSALGLKTIVLDECQHFKTADSARTISVKKLITDYKISNIIALSGTPFKNRLSEYFTILNILAPQYFNNREEFIRRFIIFAYDANGKLREMGLKNPEKFREITSKFILRRTRDQVQDQIPYVGIQRNVEFVDLEDKYKEAYDNAQADFLELFDKVENNKSAMERNSDLLAILQRMRHIVGLSKIPDTVDFVTDFLLSTERKICIFLHHNDVAELLLRQLKHWCAIGGYKPPLVIRAGMTQSELDDVTTKFNEKDNGYRILVASTLAAGEGLNLQGACFECVLMERQWNAANEEQAEARFRRIGQTSNNVIATYMIAGGTIDEMLTTIAERKRALAKAGMDFEIVKYSESELITQFAEMMEKNKVKKAKKGKK